MVGRYTVLAAATVASLSCGLNYCFSAYAPQLGTRLHLTSTQLNTVGAAGNLGVYLSSPVIGRIVDKRGPKPTLVFAAIALTSGYLVIRAFYTTAAQDRRNDLTSAANDGGWFAIAGVPGLVAAQLLTGMGSTAGLSSVGNSVAKSFRKRRAAALSVVLSGFGLSAFFYSTLSSLFLHPATTTAAHTGQAHTSSTIVTRLTGRSDDDGDDTTSAFLLLLALGSLFSMLVGLIFVEPVPPVPPSPTSTTLGKEEEESQRLSLSSGAGAAVGDEEEEGGGGDSGLTIRVVHSRAHHPEGVLNHHLRGVTTPSTSSTSGVRQPEAEETTPTTTTTTTTNRALFQHENDNVPTDRTPLLLAPTPPGSASDSTSESAAAAVVLTDRNITGWALLRELDFYLIFLFNGLCAGVGLCYINNLGTIVRSLSYPLQAESSLTPAQIARHQARLVSLLSIFNFVGRLVSGFGSDYLLHRRRRDRRNPPEEVQSESIKPNSRRRTGEITRPCLTPTATTLIPRGSIPRVVFLPLTSLLFLLSQLSLLSVSHNPSYLFLPTALTGLAHGCLFGLSGIIGLERFGIKSFSQTNGVLALAPALFGQTTNLIFGHIYDSHLSSTPSFLSLATSPSPSTCTLGQECYVRATYLTCGMSLAATVVGIGLALGRKEMRISRAV